MTLAIRAVVCVIAYLGVVVSPLVFAAVGASRPDHSFWTDFSVALGFVGLAMMGLEFALVARFRPVAAPFGQDALLQFHRQIGYVGLAFILVRLAISAHWDEVTPARALAAPALVWFGMIALLALLALIASSVWRRRLRLSYETRHIAPTVLAAHPASVLLLVERRARGGRAGGQGAGRLHLAGPGPRPGHDGLRRRTARRLLGPGPMMNAAEAALIHLDVPAERVHTERFDMV